MTLRWTRYLTLIGATVGVAGCMQSVASPVTTPARPVAVAKPSLAPVSSFNPSSPPKPFSSLIFGGAPTSAPSSSASAAKSSAPAKSAQADDDMVAMADERSERSKSDRPRRDVGGNDRFQRRGPGERPERPANGERDSARSDEANGTTSSSQNPPPRPPSGPGGFGGPPPSGAGGGASGSGFGGFGPPSGGFGGSGGFSSFGGAGGFGSSGTAVGTLMGSNPPMPTKRNPLPGNLPNWFKERDKDGDDQIGLHEWPRGELAEFEKYDLNGDGFITPEEAVRFLPRVAVAANTPAPPAAPTTPPAAPSASGTPTTPAPASGPGPVTMTMGGGGDSRAEEFTRRMAEGTLARFDKNKDGKLDEAELAETSMLRNNWREFDADKDGKLDATEIAAALKAAGARGGFGGPGGGRGGFGGPGGGRGGFGGEGGGERRTMMWGGSDPNERIKGMMQQYDKTGRGKLSPDELPRWMPRDRFPEFDADKDGYLSPDELKNAIERIFTGMRGGRGGS